IYISTMAFHEGFLKVAARNEFPPDYFSHAWIEDLDNSELAMLFHLLKPGAVAVSLAELPHAETIGFRRQPWPLIWHWLSARPKPGPWPFLQAYRPVWIFVKGEQPFQNPSTSSTYATGEYRSPAQFSLVEFCFRPFAYPGQSIVMPRGGPVVEVA